MKHSKQFYIAIKLPCGYSWAWYDKDGIHAFTAKTQNGYGTILCTEEQIENGDLEYMAEHGFTLDASRVRCERLRFRRRQKKIDSLKAVA